MKILEEPNGKKEYQRWSKSSTSNGITKEVKVEEIENGFLVTTDVWGDMDGKYTSECKKYYSKTNPLSEMDLVKSEGVVDAITDFLKEI